MKKFTFALMLAAVMLFTAAPLFAEGMMFGVKAGLNMSNWTGDDAALDFGVDPSSKMGFGGGVFFGYSFSELFGIQAEALYMMKGATYEAEFEGTTYTADAKIDYFEVPLLLKVTIPTEGKIKPAIFAGPALSPTTRISMFFDTLLDQTPPTPVTSDSRSSFLYPFTDPVM